MMRRIVLTAVFLTSVSLAVYRVGIPLDTDEFAYCEQVITRGTGRVIESISSNPFPVVLALGTFLFTVVYHKARGKSLRESVEVAATRVTVVTAPLTGGEPEAEVLRRARARATRTQLIADQIGLENRSRKLPDTINKAEQDACYTEKALSDARQTLADKEKAHDEAVARLATIRKEKTAVDAELAAIAAELKKLAEVV